MELPRRCIEAFPTVRNNGITSLQQGGFSACTSLFLAQVQVLGSFSLIEFGIMIHQGLAIYAGSNSDSRR
jgi:hypothetical protein